MSDVGWWKTTDLIPRLAERGIVRSPAQVYRLVTNTTERLSLDVLAALCVVGADLLLWMQTGIMRSTRSFMR